jgi:uncharacterized protein (TIGR02271 family)
LHRESYYKPPETLLKDRTMANLDTHTTSTSTSAVAAYFTTHAAAQSAIDRLKEVGFTSTHIGYAGRQFGNDSVEETDAGGDNAAGARSASGKAEGAWAKIKNFFEGGDVEPYADEKAGGDSVSHEITADDSDYDAADVNGTFSELAIPQTHSRYFNHRLRQGNEGAVVIVKAEGRKAEAEAILTSAGGDLGQGATDFQYPENQTEELSGAGQRIQLLGEVLRVHKDRISRGEVRLRKEVITEQQTIQVPVTREELVVERIAGDNNTPVEGSIGADKEIRIPLSEERASLDKQTIVREEVAVGKRAVEEVRNLDSDVQHEELRVEDSTRKP